MSYRLDMVKAAVENFRSVQEKYETFGAYDTEPNGIFRDVIDNVLDGKEANIPANGGEWELYTCTKPCGQAARALTSACNKVVTAIKRTTVSELPEVTAYLKSI